MNPSEPADDTQPEDSDQEFVAKVVPEDVAPLARVGPVRTGSPFKRDPPAVMIRAREVIRMRREFEAGIWRITAGGAALAAGMLIAFATASLAFFPRGVLLIAGLGGVMSLLGLTSLYPKWSLGFLLAHVALFVGSFYASFEA